MTKVCPVKLTEPVRYRLSTALGIINFLSALASMALVGIGGYIRQRLADKVHLVEDYNINTLPVTLILTGFLALFVHVFAGFVLLLNNHSANRVKMKTPLFVYMIMAAIVCIVVFACGMLCFSHINYLDNAFYGGLYNSMRQYQQGKNIKHQLDQLQTDYQCCGSSDYTDWFRMNWIPEVYHADFGIDLRGSKKPSAHDDVPFSCCNFQSRRPCIHTDVHNNAKHVGYDYTKDITLNPIGCKNALMTYLSKILLESGGVILFIFFLQVLLIITVRLLQSSVNTTIRRGPGHEEDTTMGYLCACKEPPEEYEPLDQQSDSDDDDMMLDTKGTKRLTSYSHIKEVPSDHGHHGTRKKQKSPVKGKQSPKKKLFASLSSKKKEKDTKEVASPVKSKAPATPLTPNKTASPAKNKGVSPQTPLKPVKPDKTASPAKKQNKAPTAHLPDKSKAAAPTKPASPKKEKESPKKNQMKLKSPKKPESPPKTKALKTKSPAKSRKSAKNNNNNLDEFYNDVDPWLRSNWASEYSDYDSCDTEEDAQHITSNLNTVRSRVSVNEFN